MEELPPIITEQARCLGAMLDPISSQLARTMDSDCDGQHVLALLRLRQDWHHLLCDLLKASMDRNVLPPEEVVHELINAISYETNLLKKLAIGISTASLQQTSDYAIAWMEVRERNEELLDFYLDPDFDLDLDLDLDF